MKILLIILGMSLVTMLPRIIPSFIIDKLQFKGWVSKWLNAIPYAALGALIFPGILSVHETNPFIGLLGGVFAVVLAFLRLNITLVVLFSILFVYILLY